MKHPARMEADRGSISRRHKQITQRQPAHAKLPSPTKQMKRREVQPAQTLKHSARMEANQLHRSTQPDLKPTEVQQPRHKAEKPKQNSPSQTKKPDTETAAPQQIKPGNRPGSRSDQRITAALQHPARKKPIEVQQPRI